MRELEGGRWVAGSLGGSESLGELAYPLPCSTSKAKEGSNLSSCCHFLEGKLPRDWHGLSYGRSRAASPSQHKEDVRAKSAPACALPNRREADLEIIRCWLFAQRLRGGALVMWGYKTNGRDHGMSAAHQAVRKPYTDQVKLRPLLEVDTITSFVLQMGKLRYRHAKYSA